MENDGDTSEAPASPAAPRGSSADRARRDGGGTSFRELFDAHVAYVWNTLRRLGVSESDRDDVVQEVFLTVVDLLPDYDRARPFRPWLFAIAYRVVLRHQRTRGRRRENVESPEVIAQRIEASAAPEGDALPSRQLVAAALEALPLPLRAVFVMKEIDGYDVPEVSAALGIPLNTGYSRLRLARAQFREAAFRLQRTQDVERVVERGANR